MNSFQTSVSKIKCWYYHKRMHTTILYGGDDNLTLLVSKLGVQKSLPEIKAYLMRVIWGTRPRLPSEVMDNLLGEGKEGVPATSVLIDQFREQILALWNELKRHRNVETPFCFQKFGVASSTEDLVARVKCRVKEAQMLMPLFTEDMAAFGKEFAQKVGTIKQSIIGSLEKLTSVLDSLLTAEAPVHLPGTKSELQQIDFELESAFNRLGHLLVRCSMPPPEKKAFTVLGSRGEA